MTSLLDTEHIRSSVLRQLRDYYIELTTHTSDEVITTQLLNAIEGGSIPPAKFVPWLGVARSFTILRQSLLQNQSLLVRHFAINRFRKDLRSPRWKAMWEGVGGTASILEIFAHLSVMEMKTICKAMGRCARGTDVGEKRQYITELFKALHPHIFPNTRHKLKDQRPLARHYSLLLPACESDVIVMAMDENMNGIWRDIRDKDLLDSHPEDLGQKQLSRLTDKQTKAVNQEHLRVLIHRYRPTAPSDRGFSASMKFALACLRELAPSKSCNVDEDFVVSHLIQSLLSRAVRKRVDWDQILEIVDLTLQYFENNPTAGKTIGKNVGHVAHLIASCWSRKPQLFEVQLRTLFDHPVYGMKILNELSSWGAFLSGILPSQRYALMRFCIRASTHLDIDVDADLGQVKGGLSQSLLTRLGPQKALEFFNRVRKARGDYAFLEGSEYQSILHHGTQYHVAIRDSEIWHIHLLNLAGDYRMARSCADTYIEAKSKSAKVASQPEQRGHFAKSALFAAIASGSLECYSDTLKWAQRFLNDPLVLRELYPRSFPNEAVQILSGFPMQIGSSLDLPALHSRVEMANSVLTGIFETACSAMMQPPFSGHNWGGVLALFRRVVTERIMLTGALSKKLTASNDEIYESVWEGTVTMLIALEERVNSRACERIKATGLEGILHPSWNSEETELEAAAASTLRFFDRLAKARDALWCKIRAATHPRINSIPNCLPRGLPIQHLTSSWILEVQNLDLHAPYLHSRMKATLFPDPKTAYEIMPTDEDSRTLIGVFVDSYKYALKLYIPKSCTKAVRQARVKEVWEYATGPLSRNRIHELDIVRYWQDAVPADLNEWPPEKRSTIITWLPLSEANKSTPVPWDPLAFEYTDTLLVDTEKLRYIDISIAVGMSSSYADIEHKLSLKDCVYKPLGPERRTLWDADRKLSEAEVLSALLYIDASHVDEQDYLLRVPHPSKTDCRYPAMYLDDDLMKRRDLYTSQAVNNIKGHLKNIPPELLYRLSRSVMRALDSAEAGSLNKDTTNKLHNVAMSLIIRLGESDKPSLAIHLAVDAIVDRPKSSPWHRDLLKPEFWRRLSATDAAVCYQMLASRLKNVVKEMHAKNAENVTLVKSPTASEEEDGSASRKGPYVKVTTIKMLVQILQGESVVGEGFAIETLESLVKIATHVDVRTNIVKTLLAMLTNYKSTHVEVIFKILGSAAVEAGSLDEREPLTEIDWKQAEANIEPPDIRQTIDTPIGTTSPMLYSLLSHIEEIDSDAKHLKLYLDQIIIPILDRLKQQTSRWIAIFLRKHGIDDAAQKSLEIPSVPHQADRIILRALLPDKLNLLPASILKDFVAHAIWAIAPPPSIAALNKRLKSDPALSSQPDTQTYRILCCQSVRTTETFKSLDLIALTARLSYETSTSKPTNPSHGELTAALVQEQLSLLFETLVQHDTPTYSALTSGLLHNVLRGEYLAKSWWPTHGKPILQNMISYVSSLRTPAWKANPNRSGSTLPETFPWELTTLAFSIPGTTTTPTNTPEDVLSRCKNFATNINTVLETLSMASNSGHPLLRSLEQMKNFLSTVPMLWSSKQSDVLRQMMHEDKALTATFMCPVDASLSPDMTDTQYALRIEVARYLLSISCRDSTALSKMTGFVRQRVIDMLQAWKTSAIEEVRRAGWELALELGIEDP